VPNRNKKTSQELLPNRKPNITAKKRDLGRSRRGFHLGGIDGETNNNDGEEADLLRLDAEEADPTEEEADPNEEEADRPESTPHVSTEPVRRSS
jgi:hypothetical protein